MKLCLFVAQRSWDLDSYVIFAEESRNSHSECDSVEAVKAVQRQSQRGSEGSLG